MGVATTPSRRRALVGTRRLQAGAAVAGLAAVGLVLFLIGHDLTFLQDEWVLIQTRLGATPDTYLEPHNEHLLLLPVALYKALFATVGIDEFWPYRLMVIVAHLGCVALLYLVARRSVGSRLAVFVVLPFLFAGAGWEVLLHPINVQFCVAIATVMGLLLLLDRRDRRSEIACSVLVVVAVAASSLGLSIAAGVGVALLFGRDRWRRIWIAVAPVALYGLWFLAYNQHPNYQGPRDFSPSFDYMFDAAAGSMAVLLGLSIGDETTGREYALLAGTATVVTVAAGLLLLWLVVVRRRLTPALAMLLLIAGTNWVALAVGRSFALPWTSRYVYAGAFLVVLIGLELARDYRFEERARAPLGVAVCAVATLAASLNLMWLISNAAPRREDATRVAAELGALELTREAVDRSFRPNPADALTSVIVAGRYFDAVDTLGGSPAMTASEIASSPDDARAAADGVLLRVVRPRFIPYAGQTRRFIEASTPAGESQLQDVDGGRSRGSCAVGVPRSGQAARLRTRLPASGLIVRSGSPGQAQVRLSGFGSEFPSDALGTVGREPRFLSVGLERSGIPWRVELSSGRGFGLPERAGQETLSILSGRVEACRAPYGGGGFLALGPGVPTGEVPIVPSLVRGRVDVLSVEGGTLVARGWAASADNSRGPAARADAVVVFVDGTPVAAREPSVARPDVERVMGAATRLSGFRIDLRLGPAQRGASRSGVRVFGLLGDEASEIGVAPEAG